MPAKTYVTSVDAQGNTVFTTYKVWFEGLPKSRTFDNENDANASFERFDGQRIDRIVTTVIRRRGNIV
jgi:hypothetical protein